MTTPDTAPALEPQTIDGYGTWQPSGTQLVWTPITNSPDETPRGPLLPQVHDTGTWWPGPGGFCSWEPAPTDSPSDGSSAQG